MRNKIMTIRFYVKKYDNDIFPRIEQSTYKNFDVTQLFYN